MVYLAFEGVRLARSRVRLERVGALEGFGRRSLPPSLIERNFRNAVLNRYDAFSRVL
jgi:hypothetical protein